MDKVARLNHGVRERSVARADKGAGRPSRAAAEEAVRTLIRWSGDDPDREGLLGTPARVVRAYEEWFAGYAEEPRDYLKRTFEEVGGYDEIVLLRDISFVSHCEHHIAPIIGRVHIGYLPRHRVVGISKLARLVEAVHECMTTRGVHKPGVTMATSYMLGIFRTQAKTRQEFLSAINLRKDS